MPLRKRERRRVRWTAVLAVLVLAVLGFAGYKFVSGVGRDRHAAAASQHRPPQASRASVPAGPAGVQGIRGRPARPRPPLLLLGRPFCCSHHAPSARPGAGPARPQPGQRGGVRPGRPADGDDPRAAALAVSGDAATPWRSHWYATPDFADLNSGTGLLLDMGRTVTSPRCGFRSAAAPAPISSCAPGQTGPVAAGLPGGGAANVGGTVELQLSAPAHARYLLIWFTKLPPDGAGTYQASVYKITVQGQP